REAARCRRRCRRPRRCRLSALERLLSPAALIEVCLPSEEIVARHFRCREGRYSITRVACQASNKGGVERERERETEERIKGADTLSRRQHPGLALANLYKEMHPDEETCAQLGAILIRGMLLYAMKTTTRDARKSTAD
ncbi:hypothetical protein ALC60_10890, partial [Trachymyrmex zeteki]